MSAILISTTTETAEQRLVPRCQLLRQQLHDYLDERFATDTQTYRQCMTRALCVLPLGADLRPVVLGYLECPLHMLMAPLIAHCLHGTVLLRHIATDEFRQHRLAAHRARRTCSDDHDALERRRRRQLTELWRSERDVAPSLDPHANDGIQAVM